MSGHESAFIRATPNPVQAGNAPATTTVEWSTGDASMGWVYVSVAGAPENAFASGSAGAQDAAWIERGLEYRFTLYADERRQRVLDSVVVTTEDALSGKAFIRATPNPVLSVRGRALGATMVEWSTGDGSMGFVDVAVGGAPANAFAADSAGAQEAPWIERGLEYHFTLYADERRRRLLDSVVVTTERGPSEQPFIQATPQRVPALTGPGRTTIEWSTGDGSRGWVYVAVGGAPETAFAVDPEGWQDAPWITQDVEYRFTLYADEERTLPLGSVVVTTQPVPAGKPFIRATPNPIPSSPGPEVGKTTIEWATGDASIGWVFLRTPDGKEKLFGSGSSTSLPISWVLRNYAYRFILYADADRKKKLAAVTVAMGSPTREMLLDLGVLGLAASIVAMPVVLAVWAVWRARRGRGDTS